MLNYHWFFITTLTSVENSPGSIKIRRILHSGFFFLFPLIFTKMNYGIFSVYQCLIGRVKNMEPSQRFPMTGPEATSTNWNTGNSILVWANNFILWGWSKAGRGYLKTWWSLHPWRFSEPIWDVVLGSLFQVILLSIRAWTRQAPEVPSSLSCSGIL